MISYEPLWQTMREKGVTTYALINKHGLSKGTLDALKHDRNVTLRTIEFLCKVLDVPVEKVVKITIS